MRYNSLMEEERAGNYSERLEDIQESFYAKIGKRVAEIADSSDEKDKDMATLREFVTAFASSREEVEARILKGCDGGGTFDFNGDEIRDLEGTQTLQVSFCRPEMWSLLTPTQVADLTCAIAKAYSLSLNQVYLGVYKDSEISFNFPLTRMDDVLEIAAMFNQESVLDWQYSQGTNIFDWDKAFKPNPFFDDSLDLDYEKILRKVGGESDE